MRYFIFYFCMLALACGNSGQTQKLNGKDLSFDTLLNRIVVRLGNEFAAAIEIESVGKDEFKTIYESPAKYRADVERVIADTTASRMSKTVCVYLMQKLPYDEYVQFTNYCIDQFNKGHLEEDVLYVVILPMGWKTDIRFAENYQKPEVQALCKRIQDNQRGSQRLRDGAAMICSGQMLKSRKQMNAEGYKE